MCCSRHSKSIHAKNIFQHRGGRRFNQPPFMYLHARRCVFAQVHMRNFSQTWAAFNPCTLLQFYVCYFKLTVTQYTVDSSAVAKRIVDGSTLCESNLNNRLEWCTFCEIGSPWIYSFSEIHAKQIATGTFRLPFFNLSDMSTYALPWKGWCMLMIRQNV